MHAPARQAHITLEFPPPTKPWSTNEDRNLSPYERAARIKLWKASARMLAASHRARDTQPYPLPHGVVQVTIPFTQVRRRDPHNYCGTVVKAVIDGLVLAKFWPDDTPEHVGHREPLLVAGTTVKVDVQVG